MSIAKLFDPFILAGRAIGIISRYRVMSGPFKGLRYPRNLGHGNALHAKYLGIYEQELTGVWEKLSQRAFRTIIDVGAAEGYIAVGTARVFPSAAVVAFEATPADRDAMRRLAEFNGVQDRLRCEGYCDSKALEAVLDAAQPEILLVVDIEGGEREMLDPVRIPVLRSVTLLVETHDCKIPDCEKAPIERFQESHAIERISSRPRQREDLPFWLPSLLTKWFLDASSDFRSGQQTWLCMTPMLSEPA